MFFAIRKFVREHFSAEVIDFLRSIRNLFFKERNYEFYASLAPEKYEKEICSAFRKTFGKKMSYNTVKSFNEKIQYLRCYDNSNLKTLCADKYRVRSYVSEKIGEKYLIELLGVWDRFEEINFDLLPERFVLKTNHGSGFNIVVQDKSKLDIDDACSKLQQWMNLNFAYFFLELHYRGIERKIIAEKYYENQDGNLIDYKIHCFNGEPKYIQVIGGRADPPVKEMFFDVKWTPQPFTYTYQRYSTAPQKPDSLEEMLECAEKLAEPFAYVRVDFYLLNDNSIKFGELTFTPAGGADHWDPPEWDEKLGELITLPDKKILLAK